MQVSAIRVEEEDPGSADARLCLASYFEELGIRFQTGFDPAKSISATADELRPPAGIFFVARLDGRAVGCGALKARPDGIGEVKRMWVDPVARGLGIGRRLLTTLEARAQRFGLRLLRLETNHSLVEAQALYRSSGYREVLPFNDEPYAHHWFEKPLRESGMLTPVHKRGARP
ncbi:GNAT family N-acetyltransferase [Xanthobacteraceae bacterium Astr-EGSB]|uniref:GNAT family N-acetyltransferase n=1 Tax=Astrobacterium formosum TaxID=3069710 RepID=UPI0027B1B826|nr:GNAT family N-acetyltransferase [Xanthobacteraceae bacterium Astr-EGSB]